MRNSILRPGTKFSGLEFESGVRMKLPGSVKVDGDRNGGLDRREIRKSRKSDFIERVTRERGLHRVVIKFLYTHTHTHTGATFLVTSTCGPSRGSLVNAYTCCSV